MSFTFTAVAVYETYSRDATVVGLRFVTVPDGKGLLTLRSGEFDCKYVEGPGGNEWIVHFTWVRKEPDRDSGLLGILKDLFGDHVALAVGTSISTGQSSSEFGVRLDERNSLFHSAFINSLRSARASR